MEACKLLYLSFVDNRCAGTSIKAYLMTGKHIPDPATVCKKLVNVFHNLSVDNANGMSNAVGTDRCLVGIRLKGFLDMDRFTGVLYSGAGGWTNKFQSRR